MAVSASNAASLLKKAKRKRQKAKEEERPKECEKSENKSETGHDKPDRDGRERDKVEGTQRKTGAREVREGATPKRSYERQISSASSSYPTPPAHRDQPTIYTGTTPVSSIIRLL